MTSLIGCQGLKSRTEVRTEAKAATQNARNQEASPINQSVPVGSQNLPPSESGASASPLPPSQGSTLPVGQTETFLSKELPKLGVILGPGGLKTYAHIGVLREFTRARLPIHAIVGLEWGALMAAFYAEKGLANDVDWKAFRLRESDLPSSGVLRDFKAKTMSEFDSYLSMVLPSGNAGAAATAIGANSSRDRSKIPFACPTVFRREKLMVLSSGVLKENLNQCLPFPPLVSDPGGNVAAASAVEESAQWLRSQGANLIILVNVLPSGELLSNQLGDDYGASVLWTEVRRNILKTRAPVVQWMVNVNTSGQKLDDFAQRRAAVELGARSAADLTQKLSRQYGF